MSGLLQTKQAQHDAPRPDDDVGPDNRLDRVIEAMRHDIKNLQAENAHLKIELETLKRTVKSDASAAWLSKLLRRRALSSSPRTAAGLGSSSESGRFKNGETHLSTDMHAFSERFGGALILTPWPWSPTAQMKP